MLCDDGLACGLVVPKSLVSHIGSCIIHVPSTYLEILNMNFFRRFVPNYKWHPWHNNICNNSIAAPHPNIYIVVMTFLITYIPSSFDWRTLLTNFHITCAGISIETYLSAQVFLSDRKCVLRFSMIRRKNRSAALRYWYWP